MSERGQRFDTSAVARAWRDDVRGYPHVGVHFFPTLGDRDRAVDQIQTYMASLVADVEAVVQAQSKAQMSPADINMLAIAQAAQAGDVDKLAAMKRAIEEHRQSPIDGFLKNAVYPTWNEWRKFAGDQGAVSQFFTSWDDYTGWRERLIQLRDQAKHNGVHLSLPDPPNFGRTVWGIGEGIGGLMDSVGSAAKVALWGALAIGGTFAVAKVIQVARSQ